MQVPLVLWFHMHQACWENRALEMLVSLRICLLPCCVWTEDENGEHFRRFCDGDVEQDLEGFDDALAGDTAEGLEGQEQHDGAAPDGSLRDETVAPVDDHEREHGDAEAERIFLEATAFGVDEERSQARPEPAASGRIGEEAVEELEAGDGSGEGVQPCFFRPALLNAHIPIDFNQCVCCVRRSA